MRSSGYWSVVVLHAHHKSSAERSTCAEPGRDIETPANLVVSLVETLDDRMPWFSRKQTFIKFIFYKKADYRAVKIIYTPPRITNIPQTILTTAVPLDFSDQLR